MNAHRRALGALLLAAGCGPAPAPAPPAAPPPPPASEPSACQRAATLRERASGLTTEARFFLARRALARADALCPAEASKGWVAALAIHRALGSYEAAAGIIAAIRVADDVPPEAREAAVALLREQAEHKERTPPEDPVTARSRATALARDGEVALSKRDWAQAARLFGEAHEQFEQPHLLVLRGLSLLRSGDEREGRKAIERGLAATPGARRESLETAFGRNGISAISPDDGTIFLGARQTIFEYDPTTLRERRAFDIHPDLGTLSDLKVSPDGQNVALVGSKMVQMIGRWDGEWLPLINAPRHDALGTTGHFESSEVFALDDHSTLLWSPGPRSGWVNLDRAYLFNQAADDRLTPPRFEPTRPLLLPTLRADTLLLSPTNPGERSRLFSASLVAPGQAAFIASALAPIPTAFAASVGDTYAGFDARSGRKRWTNKSPHPVDTLFFLDSGRLLAESPLPTTPEVESLNQPAEQRLELRDRRIVNALTGKPLVSLEPTPSVAPLGTAPRRYQLSGDGKTITALSPDFVSWDLASGKVKGRARRPCLPGSPLALLPDGSPRCIELEPATGEYLVDASTGERRIVHPRWHYHGALVALSPGAEALAVLDNSGVLHHFRLLENTWKAHLEKQERPDELSWVASAHLALSPRGDAVAWALPKPGSGMRLSVARGGEASSTEFLDAPIASLSLSGDLLLACQRDGRPVTPLAVPSLEAAPGFERLPDKESGTRCSLSPDGRWFACASAFNDISLRDAKSGRLVSALRAPQTSSPEGTGFNAVGFSSIRHLVFSGDGRVLASASAHEIHLWDAERAALTGVIPRPGQSPDVVLSNDGSRLGVMGVDGTLSLLSAPWGTPIASAPTNHLASRLLFAGDGRLVALTDAGFFSLDDTGLPPRHTLLPGHIGAPRRNVAYAPRPGLLAVINNDGVSLIDEASGQLRATLRLIRQGKGWHVTTPDGLADWGGDPEALRQVLSCRVDSWVFPMDVCEDRVRVPGLLSRIARGERPSLDP